jgi:hypothetical protein
MGKKHFQTRDMLSQKYCLGNELDNLGFDPGRDNGLSSFPKHPNDPGAHPASYPMTIKGYIPSNTTAEA